MPTDQPTPRRKWHLKRWFVVFVVALFSWSGWRVHDHRSAIKEAQALGWTLEYTDTAKEIRADWKNAFRKATWTDGVTFVDTRTSESFQQHVAIVHRLNPRRLRIENASTLRDLSAIGSLTRLQGIIIIGGTALTNIDGLKNLAALKEIGLVNCTSLTNVDVLKNLSALQGLSLSGCTGLTNVDALKSLSALGVVDLNGCTGLTNVDVLTNLRALGMIGLRGCTGLMRESVEALRAALPKAQIIEP